jgi:PAS domain S-box-containing protein
VFRGLLYTFLHLNKVNFIIQAGCKFLGKVQKEGNIFKRISKWGQDPTKSAAYNSRVVVTNNLLMVSTGLCIFLASLFYYQGLQNHLIGQAIAVVIYGLSLLLSALKKVEWAKIVALILSNLGMFTFMTALGEHKGITLIVFTLVSVPFVVFEFRQWHKIAFFVLAPLVLYYLLNITDYKFIKFEPVAPNLKEIIFMVLFASSTLSIVLCALFLIKERLEDQRKLGERQSLISKIAEISPNIIYIFDIANNKPVYANNNLQNIMGYGVGELKWEIIKGLIHPQDMQEVENNTRILFARKDNQPVITTYRMRTKLGNYIWVRNRSQVFERDEKGKVKLVLGVSEDISEKIAEKEAFTSLDYLQKNILEASPYAIISTDAYGIITTFNTAAEKMFGYDATELVGKKTPSKMFDRKEVITRAKQMSKELGVDISPPLFVIVQRPLLGLPDFSEWTYVKKDGTRFPALITVNVLKDEKGNVTGYLGIAQDITKRKREEQTLTKAKIAAEDANKAKSQFLANMSHEIRTPLNAILGMTDLTLEGPLSDEQRQYLGYVKESGFNLLQVINDILDFSKIESGVFELYPTDFNLHTTINSIIKSTGVKANQKNLELFTDFDKDIPAMFIGDSVRLGQVLTNLMGNAVKFTDKGHIALSVEKLGDDDDYMQLRFKVSDTGIGIAPNKHEYIFQAFAQVDDSHKRVYQGTGLGLSISRRLVEQMNGRIWIESEPGQGSHFIFTVKLKISLQPEPKMPNYNHLQLLTLVDSDGKKNSYGNLAGVINLPYQSINGIAQLSPATAPGKQCILLVDHAEYAELLPAINDQLANTNVVKLVAINQNTDIETKASIEELGFKILLKPIICHDLKGVLDNYPAQVSAPRPDVAQVSGRSAVMAANAPLHFLVVEDNDVNRLLTSRVIEKLGYNVDVAENGEEGVERINARVYDMVIMDIQMPKMDGLEATQLIREIDAERGIHTPIIAMTAHAMKGDREKYLVQGIDEYISKPFERKQLEEKIQILTDRFERPTQFFNQKKSQAMENGEAPKVDLSYLENLLNGNENAISEVLTMFITQTPSLLGEMRNAYSNGQMDKLSKITHKLKGTLVAIGVNGKDMERLKTIEEQSIIDADKSNIKAMLDTSTYRLLGIVDEIKEYVENLNHKTNA